MNDIFQSSINNNYTEYIKKNIIINVHLTQNILNICYHNYYVDNYNINKHGLYKFIYTIININFKSINPNHIHILLYLSSKKLLTPNLLKINKHDIIKKYFKLHNNSINNIITNIISGLSYCNRDLFFSNYLNYKKLLESLLKSNKPNIKHKQYETQYEKFVADFNTNNNTNNNTDNNETNNDSNTTTQNESEYPINNINENHNRLFLYTKDNNYSIDKDDSLTLHYYDSSNTIKYPKNLDKIKENNPNLTSEQIGYYVYNENKLYATYNYILKNSENVKHKYYNYFLLTLSKLDELKNKPEVLYSRYLDFNAITNYLFKNQNNHYITNKSIEEIINIIYFDSDLSNIKTVDDVKKLHKDKLLQYQITTFNRNCNVNDLREIYRFSDILEHAYTYNQKQYYKFITYINKNNRHKYINLTNYNNLSQDKKDDFINNLNNLELNYILQLLKPSEYNKYTNEAKLHEKIVLYVNNNGI